MKKKFIGLALIVIIVSIFSIYITNLTPKTILNQLNNTNKPIVNNKIDADIFRIEGHADWANVSKDIESLFKDSDLIVKAKITSVNYYCGNGGLIYTKSIPEIIETYKGSYDGLPIKSIGGIVDYEEYIKHDVDPNNFKEFESKTSKKPKKIELVFDDIYTIHSGEEYILFCQKVNGEMSITNSFEGLFKVNVNKVTNKALKNSKKLSNDIEKKVSKEHNITNSSVIDGLNKDSFITTIKSIKN